MKNAAFVGRTNSVSLLTNKTVTSKYTKGDSTITRVSGEGARGQLGQGARGGGKQPVVLRSSRHHAKCRQAEGEHCMALTAPIKAPLSAGCSLLKNVIFLSLCKFRLSEGSKYSLFPYLFFLVKLCHFFITSLFMKLSTRVFFKYL